MKPLLFPINYSIDTTNRPLFPYLEVYSSQFTTLQTASHSVFIQTGGYLFRGFEDAINVCIHLCRACVVSD
jgi:hypothetical protein